MYLLALNSAEGVLQLALARKERQAAPWSPLFYEALPAASQGAELLAPRIRLGLERLDLTPDALTHLALVRGPGSFTGLRLALATAAGLARASGALQAGLDYLPLLAASALLRLGREKARPSAAPEAMTTEDMSTEAMPTAPHEDQTPAAASVLWVLTHARRNLVHAQAFAARTEDRNPDGPERCGPQATAEAGDKREAGVQAGGWSRPQALSQVLVVSPEELLKLTGAQEADQGTALLGSGLERNRTFFEEAAKSLRASGRPAPKLLGQDFALPLPEALLAAAASANFGPEDVTPFYARPCDAEENLERIAAGLGLDPADARLRLEQLTGKLP